MIAITLSILFGLGWGIGLPATQALHTAAIRDTFSVLFILLTAFQGLLIFIMRCARSSEVVKQWKKWLSCVMTKHSEEGISFLPGKVHLPRKSSMSGPTCSSCLSDGSGTFERATIQKTFITTSANDEFSVKVSNDDDDNGKSTLKLNLAKSGILPGLSTIQHAPLSLPETIAEKEEAAEFADIEGSEKVKVTTTFMLPLHVQEDVIENDGFENTEKFSLPGEEMDYDVENACLALPTMSHSTSSRSLLSTKSETSVHITSFTTPNVYGRG